MRRVLAVALLSALGATGALVDTPPRTDAAEPRLTVVAGFHPLAEWAAIVGDPRVRVGSATPAGGDPHDVEPTPADLRRLREADVVLTLAPGFQPALDRALAGAAPGRQVRVVVAAGLGLEGRPGTLGGSSTRGGDHAADPHVWLDPVLAARIVVAIGDALARADPEGRARYEANARAYAARLEALDERYRRTLTSCRRRLLVTSHAAFGHLAARYGLEQHAIRGASPEAEPTPRRLAELADLMKRRGVRYVFTETIGSPKVAETLAREAGARTLRLHTLEALSDQEIAEGKTYLGLMEENLAALATGLECQA